MSKVKSIIFIILFFGIMCISGNTFADDSNEFKMESVSVTNPTTDGIYGVGQEISIKIKFNKKIKGKVPNLIIYFGNESSNANKIEIPGYEIAEFTSELVFKYNVKMGDNGRFNVDSFAETNETFETEDGDNYYWNTNVDNVENKILVDTSIDWVNTTNSEIIAKRDNENRGAFHLEIENFNQKNNNSYYIKLSHNSDENFNFLSREEMGDNWSTINENNIVEMANYNLFAETQEVYGYIYEIDNVTKIPKQILKSKKINKIASLALTQRLNAAFTFNGTSVDCYEYYGNEARPLSYKIGIIADKNLLVKLKNNDTSAFEELMQYAKNNKEIYSGTINLGLTDRRVIDTTNLDENEYYFIYLSMDTENGKYQTIEDINIGVIEGTGSQKSLFSTIYNEIDWSKLSETKNGDTTIANKELSKAGTDMAIIWGISLIIIAGLVGLIKYKQYRDIK